MTHDPIDLDKCQAALDRSNQIPTRIYGTSDDLIEVDSGKASGEVGGCFAAARGQNGVLLCCSDGTVLQVKYGKKCGGVWEIKVLRKGELFERIDICTDDDTDPHSDEVFFKSDLKWVYAAKGDWELVKQQERRMTPEQLAAIRERLARAQRAANEPEFKEPTWRFISLGREDLPRLLAEIERLTAEVDRSIVTKVTAQSVEPVSVVSDCRPINNLGPWIPRFDISHDAPRPTPLPNDGEHVLVEVYDVGGDRYECIFKAGSFHGPDGRTISPEVVTRWRRFGTQQADLDATAGRGDATVFRDPAAHLKFQESIEKQPDKSLTEAVDASLDQSRQCYFSELQPYVLSKLRSDMLRHLSGFSRPAKPGDGDMGRIKRLASAIEDAFGDGFDVAADIEELILKHLPQAVAPPVERQKERSFERFATTDLHGEPSEIYSSRFYDTNYYRCVPCTVTLHDEPEPPPKAFSVEQMRAEVDLRFPANSKGGHVPLVRIMANYIEIEEARKKREREEPKPTAVEPFDVAALRQYAADSPRSDLAGPVIQAADEIDRLQTLPPTTRAAEREFDAMTIVSREERTQLNETNQHLAPIVARWLHAYWECSSEVQIVVREMFDIVTDEHAEDDEKEIAIATALEALFPSSHNGALGADLEELERDNKNRCRGAAKTIESMDQEEAVFSDRVNRVMKDKGMTQELLAKAVGIGQPAISMLLSRGARPQRRTVARIAEALGVPPSDLWPESLT